MQMWNFSVKASFLSSFNKINRNIGNFLIFFFTSLWIGLFYLSPLLLIKFIKWNSGLEAIIYLVFLIIPILLVLTFLFLRIYIAYTDLFLKASQGLKVTMAEIFRVSRWKCIRNLILFLILIYFFEMSVLTLLSILNNLVVIFLLSPENKTLILWTKRLIKSWGALLVLFYAIRLNFIIPLLVDKDYGIWKAIKQSRKITKGYVLKLIPLILMKTILYGIVGLFLYYFFEYSKESFRVAIVFIMFLIFPFLLSRLYKMIQADCYHFLIQEYKKNNPSSELTTQQAEQQRIPLTIEEAVLQLEQQPTPQATQQTVSQQAQQPTL